MFFRKPTVVTVGTQHHVHNTRTEVIEKKAPTDESLKLLDQFRKEALNSVIDRGLVNVPSIDADIAYMRRLEDFYKKLDFRIVLNGRTIRGSYEIDYNDDTLNIEQLLEEVSKAIAKELITKVLYKEHRSGTR